MQQHKWFKVANKYQHLLNAKAVLWRMKEGNMARYKKVNVTIQMQGDSVQGNLQGMDTYWVDIFPIQPLS